MDAIAASTPAHEPRTEDAAARIKKFTELAQHTEQTLNRYEARFAEQQAELALLREELKQVQTNVAIARERLNAAQPVPPLLLDQIAKGIVRVTVLTLIGGLAGGPLFALATNTLLGPNVLAAAVGGFVTAVSSELSDRAEAKAPELVARQDGSFDDISDDRADSEFDYRADELNLEDEDDDSDGR